VRVANTPQTLLAAPLLTVDSDPKSWLDHALLDVPVARVRQVEEHPAQGPSYTVAREKKEQNDFTVSPLPKGRELTSAAAAEPITTSLASLSLDDVRKGDPKTDPPAARALYRTFDGLELEISGRKDGNRSLIAASARPTGKDSAAEADRLNARLSGWEFEIPDYKYTAMFSPLEDLLKKPPQPAKKAAATAKPEKGANPAKSATPPSAIPAK
jgi:hypothetical protein